MNKIIILLFSSLLLFQCNSSGIKNTTLENENYIQLEGEVLLDTLKNVISIQDLIQSLKNTSLENQKLLLKTLEMSVYSNPGEPVTVKELEDNFYYPSYGDTKYIYFYEEDFKRLFQVDSSCKEQRGIRIYLAKYKNDFKDSKNNKHRYAGKNTVILKSMCGNSEIDLKTFSDAVFDYGDVCPPNCDNLDKKGDRNSQEVKDGVPSLKK